MTYPRLRAVNFAALGLSQIRQVLVALFAAELFFRGTFATFRTWAPKRRIQGRESVQIDRTDTIA
jgi:hypothetical protein